MKKILYTGLDCPTKEGALFIHCPLIEIVPKSDINLSGIENVSHFIMTSKSAVTCFFNAVKNQDIFKKKPFLSVGLATTHHLKSFGVSQILTAATENQEGAIELIQELSLDNPLFFWGHSSLSRQVLGDFLREQSLSFIECILYETRHKAPEKVINFDEVDEIFFSSPSTVEAFCHFFGSLPKNKVLRAQGAITELAIKEKLLKNELLKRLMRS